MIKVLLTMDLIVSSTVSLGFFFISLGFFRNHLFIFMYLFVCACTYMSWYTRRSEES